MQSPLASKDLPYVAAFISSTLDPTMQLMFNSGADYKYFITHLQVVPAQRVNQAQYSQQIKINDTFSLLVKRDPTFLPISDVAHFQQIPQGWEPVNVDQQILHKFKSVLCYKRSTLKDNSPCLYNLQIINIVQQQKAEQVTQPSLTEKSQMIHNYFKIETDDLTRYINFVKKAQLQISNLRFKPLTTSLFERNSGEINIPNLSILCFPEGVKIFKKQSGFKFFSFIITNDSAQRFYCKSIIFSQKCPNEVTQLIEQKYGVSSDKGLYCQKVLTLISQYNCTEPINSCLQYIYRVYLSKPCEQFLEKINELSKSLTIQQNSNKIKLEMEDFDLNFKMNTSYPHTSNQAIYAVFKFMQVENIVTVIQNLLLQRKIFFVSNCQNIIGMAIQAFLSFIYPLCWIHGIISPVPISMVQYTEAPMTIIYGLSNNTLMKVKPNIQALFVYLDSNKVELRNCKQVNMMVSVRKQLIERLKQYEVYDPIDVRDYLLNPENLALFKTQKAEDPHFDSYMIRNIFFQLTVFMLRNYQDYFKKFQKGNSEKIISHKKYYDMQALLHLYRKDQFMSLFFQTSLFNVLTQRKMEQPNNKWIKTLDRAIKKINGYAKRYIQEESDISDNNELEQKEDNIIPRGCLHLISSCKSSDSGSHPKSSPSPKRSKQREYLDEKLAPSTPSRTHNRMSLPNQYEKRNILLMEGNTILSKRVSLDNSPLKRQDSTQKQQKQTDKGSDSCDKSQTSAPQLGQNHVQIVYQFELDKQQNQKQEEEQQTEGLSTLICNLFSYPYRRMTGSVVSRWTKRKINKIKSWKSKKEAHQIDMVVNQKNENVEPQQKNNELDTNSKKILMILK